MTPIHHASKVWFPVADLLEALGVAATDPGRTLKRLHVLEEHRASVPKPGRGGTQNCLAVTFAGACQILLEAKSERAETLRYWIATHILPARAANHDAMKVPDSGPGIDLLRMFLDMMREAAPRSHAAVAAAGGSSIRPAPKQESKARTPAMELRDLIEAGLSMPWRGTGEDLREALCGSATPYEARRFYEENPDFRQYASTIEFLVPLLPGRICRQGPPGRSAVWTIDPPAKQEA